MSISSINFGAGGFSSYALGGSGQRPSSSQVADQVFKSIDTSGNGYITSDQLTAFEKQAPALPSGVKAPDAKSLDTNGDGKITADEFKTGFKQLESKLDSQFQSLRSSGQLPSFGSSSSSSISNSNLQQLLSSLTANTQSSNSASQQKADNTSQLGSQLQQLLASLSGSHTKSTVEQFYRTA